MLDTFVTTGSPQTQQLVLGRWSPAQTREVEMASRESGLGYISDPISYPTTTQAEYDAYMALPEYQPPITDFPTPVVTLTPPNIPWPSGASETKSQLNVKSWFLKNKTIVYAAVAGVVAFALTRR